MGLHVVILAAGQGTRMKSALPKVLHPVAGVPMVERVVQAASALGAASVHVVVGAEGTAVRNALADHGVAFVTQAEQLGTGHAVMQVVPELPDSGRLLVLFADGPLIRPETLAGFAAGVPDEALGLLTARFPDPTGFGRIVRDDLGTVSAIVEERDASEAQRAITEINTGIMLLPLARLSGWLDSLSAENAQSEYYLTDVIAMAVAAGVPVQGVLSVDPDEVLGVNDRRQLAAAERIWQRRVADDLLAAGVSLADPARIDVRGRLTAAPDCYIDVNAVFEGEVTLGEGVRIGPNCCLRDTVIEAGAQIHANTVIDGARVGPGCSVGPFARLRPGAELAAEVRVGNFVELKKSTLGQGAKANHLAYIGDADIGAGSNVGAGTITCNYDGRAKHRTTLGERVFVGSNATLVAPLTLNDDVFVAAGSTVTTEVQAGALVVGRSRQSAIPGWVHPAERGKRAAARNADAGPGVAADETSNTTG